LARFRELQRENAWSRIHLVPLLLAEGDRDAYRREQAALAREREIMKDVPGWEVRARQRSPDEMLMILLSPWPDCITHRWSDLAEAGRKECIQQFEISFTGNRYPVMVDYTYEIGIE
jgi:hypothetical protein